MTPAVQDASCAAGAFLCRGSEAQPVLDRRAALRCSQAAIPSSKKEYFLTATTPQALARGVTARLVQKPRRVSPPQRRKKVSIIFSGDMCGGENTSQAASVEFVCRRRTNYARSRLQPLCQKVILFDSDNPAGDCLRGCLRVSAVHCIRGGPCPLGLPCGSISSPSRHGCSSGSDNPAGRSLRGCLSMTLQAQQSVFLNRDAGELRLGQITPTALPSSRQTAS